MIYDNCVGGKEEEDSQRMEGKVSKWTSILPYRIEIKSKGAIQLAHVSICFFCGVRSRESESFSFSRHSLRFFSLSLSLSSKQNGRHWTSIYYALRHIAGIQARAGGATLALQYKHTHNVVQGTKFPNNTSWNGAGDWAARAFRFPISMSNNRSFYGKYRKESIYVYIPLPVFPSPPPPIFFLAKRRPRWII